MTTLVIAEHDNSELHPVSLAAVTAARALGDAVDVLVAGCDCGAVAGACARVAGVGKVLLADAEAYRHQLSENVAPLIVSLAGDYSHLLACATTAGKNLMPRVAALLDVAQISDIIAVEAPDTFRRPIYAGSVIATLRSTDPVRVITLRATAFAPAAAEGGSARVEALDRAQDAGLSSWVEDELNASDRPELGAADTVIAGGRGLGSAESFGMLEELADKLGAAVGASRAAVDAGFVPNALQIGQTGKVVAPKLYIAVGISGAIQHLAGVQDSQVIVAINKDEDAPIFQVADYGIVGDLFQVLPQLMAELDKPAP